MSTKKHHNRTTVGDHIRSLPLLKQLSASQQMLIKLTPNWQNWASRCLPQKITGQATLSHFDNGKLVIACENATVATQIKHQQHSLVADFHQNGLIEVEQVIVRIEHTTQNHFTASNLLTQHSPTIDSESSADKRLTTMCENALESISQCRKSVKNEELSNALSRLEKTLKDRL